MSNYKDKKYRGSSKKMKNDKDLGIDDLKLVSFSSLSADEVLCYNGTNWVNGTVSGGGGGSISCFSYNSGSSALVATADLTSTCSALFGDVLISGNTITPDDSNTVTCLGSDGTLNISGNLDVQGDFLKLPQATSSSTITGNAASAGALRYNTTTNTIQVHNGTEFTGVGGSGSSTLSGLSDTTISSPSSGQVLKYNGSAWVNDTDAGGIALTDLSVGTEASASGDGGIAYNSGTGVFTYTPPTATGIGALADITSENLSALANVDTTAPTDGQVLTWDNANSYWKPATSSGGASSLNELSDVIYDTDENLGIGTNALDSLQAQNEWVYPEGNIGIGLNAGTANIAGCNNIIVGWNALCSACSANRNTAIGCEALRALPQGSNNTAIGAGALKAQSNSNGQNTAVGAFAGNCITTGCFNTLIGRSAGWKLTTQGYNTLIGDSANGGSQATGGNCNTIIGYAAATCNNGCDNVVIGVNALYQPGSSSPTGNNNVYIGNYAAQRVTGGNNNTAVGYMAARCTTASAQTNTSLGYYSGYQGQGNCNVYIGPYAGGTNCHTGCNNVLIGYQATVSSSTVSNEITLGHTTHTSLRANVTTISSLSDQRDKTNICDLSVGLCFVDELKPVTFDWNRRDGTMSGHKDVGFIAQDLDLLQQKYNIEDHLNIVLKSNPDRLEASPGKLIPILVKAIQELTKKVEELENKIGK